MKNWVMAFFDKIVIASDHAGYDLKNSVIKHLSNSNIKISDLGCNSLESCDYPDFGYKLAQSISDKTIGILICGSGIGMSIAANRFKHIRAALCHSAEYARLAREHNNANVLVLGARFLSRQEAENIIEVFLNTDFAGNRHMTRVEKLSNFGD